MVNLTIINVVIFGANFLICLIHLIFKEEKHGWFVATAGWLVAFLLQLDKVI